MIKFKDPSWTKEHLMGVYWRGELHSLQDIVNGWHSSWFKVLSGIKYTGNFKGKDYKVGKI